MGQRLLMWDMQRNIETEALPAHRVVVRFRFTDPAPGLPRVTWLILDRAHVDVCYKDPGHPIDLYVTSSLRSLTSPFRPARCCFKCARLKIAS